MAYGRPFAAGEPGYTIATVAENVRGLKVYLSADGGQNWAGLGSNPASWDDIVTELMISSPPTGRRRVVRAVGLVLVS